MVDLENLPTFMAHLEEVRATGDRTSHWSAGAPFGKNVGWDAEIVDEVPGEKIAWRSTGNADVPNAGTVWFGPAPNSVSTEVHVVLDHDIPGGTVGKAVAKYFGEERTSSSMTTCAGSSRSGDRRGDPVRRRPVGQTGSQGVPAASGATPVGR